MVNAHNIAKWGRHIVLKYPFWTGFSATLVVSLLTISIVALLNAPPSPPVATDQQPAEPAVPYPAPSPTKLAVPYPAPSPTKLAVPYPAPSPTKLASPTPTMSPTSSPTPTVEPPTATATVAPEFTTTTTPSPTTTLSPTAEPAPTVTSNGIGLDLTTWEEGYGPPEEEESGFFIYKDGAFTIIPHDNENIWYLERTWKKNEFFPLEDARKVANGFIPSDSEFVEHIELPEEGKHIDFYRSEWLIERFPEKMGWGEIGPGGFTVTYISVEDTDPQLFSSFEILPGDSNSNSN